MKYSMLRSDKISAVKLTARGVYFQAAQYSMLTENCGIPKAIYRYLSALWSRLIPDNYNKKPAEAGYAKWLGIPCRCQTTWSV
jgi:hypothetical protein